MKSKVKLRPLEHVWIHYISDGPFAYGVGIGLHRRVKRMCYECIDEEQIERRTQPDCFRTVREGGVTAVTGLRMVWRDDDLRYGTLESRMNRAHVVKYHDGQHWDRDYSTAIIFPAGKPLNTDKEIRAWRNKQTGIYRLDNWILKHFIHAHRYATGKAAQTKQGYIIQKGKLPRQMR